MIDKIDRKILTVLQRNARMSHQDLSECVGLSPTPCSRRIRNLETAGIIKGYTVNIDESQIGFGFSSFISVRLDHQSDDRLVSFEEEINAMPEVVDCWLTTGSRDYLLRIVVADLREFETFLTGRLTKVNGVASIESSIQIRCVKQQLARLN